KSVVLEVRKTGQRVKVVLSRCHPDFVRCLFEAEIPEIEDHTIEIRAIAREAGYRTKIAVTSIDMKVDCVGACVGVRGSRIKIMTHDEYNDGIDLAENWFRALPGITDEMVEALIVEGFLSYTDLTFLDAAGLMEIIPVDEETGDEMIACAEEWAEEAEEQARQAEAEAQ